MLQKKQPVNLQMMMLWYEVSLIGLVQKVWHELEALSLVIKEVQVEVYHLYHLIKE